MLAEFVEAIARDHSTASAQKPARRSRQRFDPRIDLEFVAVAPPEFQAAPGMLFTIARYQDRLFPGGQIAIVDRSRRRPDYFQIEP
jgi:hypothetical protein